MVDRGEFDLRLLTGARSLDVRVHQPARVLDCKLEGSRWRIQFEADGRRQALGVDFVADARGRRGGSSLRQCRTGAPTLALFAYWRGPGVPRTPRIEAGRAAWYWGVPLPDGLYNTLVFVDPRQFRLSPGTSASERFFELLDRSSLLESRHEIEPVGAVRATDATPYLERECVTPRSIRVGDAALAIDPISSSGVQRAIQSALSGAVVANTLIRRPDEATAAVTFYAGRLAETSERHRRWAADHYRAVAVQNKSAFWADRSAGLGFAAPAPAPMRALDAGAITAMPVERSRQLNFVRTPRLDGEFVSLGWALSHPGTREPGCIPRRMGADAPGATGASGQYAVANRQVHGPIKFRSNRAWRSWRGCSIMEFWSGARTGAKRSDADGVHLRMARSQRPRAVRAGVRTT